MNLDKDDVKVLLDRSEHYSGPHIKSLCKEATMGPVGGVPEKRVMRRFERSMI